MAQIIKNVQVTWAWTGDTEALKGFNVVLTKTGETPHDDTTAFAKTGAATLSHTFSNVTLDNATTYEAWVQALYDGDDSDWVSVSSGISIDDGNATIETPTGAQDKADAAVVEATNTELLSKNPTFKDWTGSFPADWLAWVTTPAKETTLTRLGGNAVRYNVTATNAGIRHSFPSTLAFTEYVEVELDYHLVSGSLSGAGLLIDWQGGSTYREYVSLYAEMPDVTGEWATIKKTIKAPAGASGDFSAYTVYLMANYGSGLGTMATKDIIFDRFSMKPASQAAIEAYNAETPAGAQSKADAAQSAAEATASADATSKANSAQSAAEATAAADATAKTDAIWQSSVMRNNLLDVSQWTIGQVGSQGTFWQNKTGVDEENVVEMLTGPYGYEEPIWHCTANGDNNADGGWNCDFTDGYDETKPHRFVVWMKQESDVGTVYLGCGTAQNLGSWTDNTNPYFIAGDLPATNKWYLVVGILHGTGYTGSDSGIAGIYDPETGEKIYDGSEYRAKPGINPQRHRAYQYYSGTTPGSEVWFARPRVDELNGNEPSLTSLMGLGAVKNTNVTIDADGNLLGAGGGQVDLNNASPITLTSTTTNVVINGTKGVKNGADAWDGDLHTEESYVGGAYASARVGQTNCAIMFGLSDTPTNGTYTGINHAIYFKNNGGLEIYQNGSVISGHGTYNSGDTASVVYDGVNVRYYHNGVQIGATFAESADKKFHFDSSLYENGAKLSSIQFGPVGSSAWDKVGGANKPADGADVTLDQLAGSGVNIVPPGLSSFESGVLPATSHAGGITPEVYDGISYFGSKAFRLYSTVADGWCYMATTTTTYNIPLTPNKKWIISAYVRNASVNSGTGQLFIRTGVNHYTVPFTTHATAGQWSRVSGVCDLSGDASAACNIRLDNDEASSYLYFDGIMIEEQIGTGAAPSAYVKPYDFKEEFTGDLDANKTTDTNQLTDGAGLGEQANVTMNQGGFGNIRFLKNHDGNATNDGEIGVFGDTFYHPDGTKRTITGNKGVATPYEGATTVDRFYLIYTDETPVTRFAAYANYAWTSPDFFPAIYDKPTKQWKAVGNDLVLYNFTPLETDVIVGSGSKTSTSGGLDFFNSFIAANTNLPADGATVGADWDSDIANKPNDDMLLNSEVTEGIVGSSGNLLINGDMKIRAADNRPAGVKTFYSSDTSTIYMDAGGDYMIVKSGTDTSTGAVMPMLRVAEGVKYKVKVRAKSDMASGSGFYIIAYGLNYQPTVGWTHIAYTAGGAESGVALNTSTTYLLSNSNITTGWLEYTGEYTPPAGITYFSIAVLNYTGMGLTGLHIDNIEVVPMTSITAGNVDDVIADNSIPGMKVTSLDADKINATNLAAISADLGTITAGSIDINNKAIIDSAGNATFKGVTIEDGSGGVIMSSSGGMGIGGANMLRNGLFVDGFDGWNSWTDGGDSYTIAKTTDSAWYPKNGHAIHIHQHTNAASNSSMYADDVHIIAGDTYCFSAYTGAHRCKATINIEWYDSSGTFISTSYGTENDEENTGGTVLTGYKRLHVIAVAPGTAVLARCVMTKGATNSPHSDSWLFMTHAQLSQVPAGSTLIPPFSDNSTYIAAAKIGTLELQDGAINNAKMGTASVDTLELAGQAVTIPVSAYVSSASLTNVKVTEATIVSTGAPIVIWYSVQANTQQGGGATYRDVVIKRGGVVKAKSGATSPNDGGADALGGIFIETPGAGTHTYEFWGDGAGYATTGSDWSLVLMEVKR